MGQNRIIKFSRLLESNGIDCAIVIGTSNVAYLSGFMPIATMERPIIFVQHISSEPTLIVPILELEHAREKSWVKDIRPYYEYKVNLPNAFFSYLDLLEAVVNEKVKISDKLAFDLNNIPAKVYLKYATKFRDRQILDCTPLVDELRMIKDEKELELLKISAKITDKTLDYLINEAVKPGKTELELLADIISYVNYEGAKYFPQAEAGLEGFGCGVIWSGPRSAMPHSAPSTRKIVEGDSIILSVGAKCAGYSAEDERTVFLGKPSEEKMEYFKVAYEAQQKAFEASKPGARAGDVDSAALNHIRSKGMGMYIKHRTGHGIGLDFHEPPYLREDNDLILKEGMVYSVEPGVYVEGVGGFRHSDTLLVTRSGYELLTKYPRELDSLIIQL
ncbi:MAG: Xaa-Pro peptidase family protein [Nitrososphaeria archaeon]